MGYDREDIGGGGGHEMKKKKNRLQGERSEGQMKRKIWSLWYSRTRIQTGVDELRLRKPDVRKDEGVKEEQKQRNWTHTPEPPHSFLTLHVPFIQTSMFNAVFNTVNQLTSIVG